MGPQLQLVTLGVRDLGAARAFYRDGLGWEPRGDFGAVVVFQVGHGLLLGLFGIDDLEADVAGDGVTPEPRATPGAGMTLAQVLDTEDEVRAAVERAVAAGARVLKEPQHAAFGGFHAYVADPDGFRWELSTNPGLSIDADGRVEIAAIEPG